MFCFTISLREHGVRSLTNAPLNIVRFISCHSLVFRRFILYLAYNTLNLSTKCLIISLICLLIDNNWVVTTFKLILKIWKRSINFFFWTLSILQNHTSKAIQRQLWDSNNWKQSLICFRLVFSTSPYLLQMFL